MKQVEKDRGGRSPSAGRVGYIGAVSEVCNLLKETKRWGRGGRQMRCDTRKTIVTGLVLVLLIGQWGCATKTVPPLLVLSEQDRAKLRTIRVVSARFPPEVHLEPPTSAKWSGAQKGAVMAIGAVASGARGGDVLIVLALSPVLALGGAIYGAIAIESESSERVEGAEAALNRAVVDLNIQEAMRDRVFQIVQQETSDALTLLTGQGSNAPDAVAADRSSPSQDTDAILEVSVTRFGFEATGGPNPPLLLAVTAHARLVRVADGTEFYSPQRTYRSGTLKFVEWAANDAQPLRAELDRAVQVLAGDIVRDLFFLYLPHR